MSMRAADEGDEEESTVYLGQPPVSTVDLEGRDVSVHGSDSRGYKSLLHDNDGNFVNNAMGLASGRFSDIVSSFQSTFAVKENLDRLVHVLKLTSLGLVIVVFVIILAQKNPRKVNHYSASSVNPPTFMPTFAPGTTYDYESMLGKIVSNVPTSYVYQSNGCMRECYRAPFYRSPSINTLTSACGSTSDLFIGVRNAYTGNIEIGSFQYANVVFQNPNVNNPNSDNLFSLSGTESNGLYWYSLGDGFGKRTFGFSTSPALNFQGIEPASGYDCEKMFFTTAVTASNANSGDYSGTYGCERFSNQEQSIGAQHEIIIYHNTC